MLRVLGGLIRCDIKPTMYKGLAFILTWKSRSMFNKRNPKTFDVGWDGVGHYVIHTLKYPLSANCRIIEKLSIYILAFHGT